MITVWVHRYRENGMEGLLVATILAGIILILMGLLKFGSLIKFIPYTITTGFTAGIAVTIVVGQIKSYLGLTTDPSVNAIETVEKIEEVIRHIDTMNWSAVIVGIVSSVILWICPKLPGFLKKIPGSLVAVIAGILMVSGLNMDVKTIGELYTITSELPKFHLPAISFDTINNVLPDAFTIAILAAIESLLSCVVADSMVNSKHRSNMELVAQGIGNVGSALFGGIPATGAIARTAANVKNGGRTPIAGMVHAVVLLLILVVFMPFAGMIPMPTIAAILFMVAYNMSEWRHFVHLLKTAPKSDIIVLVLTFALTVMFDLVVAIGVGIVLAAMLFMKRMSEVTDVASWKYIDDENDPDSIDLKVVPKNTVVYEISGPLFFGAADKILNIKLKEKYEVLILRMRSVTALDATALHFLEQFCEKCEKKGIKLILSHVNEQPMHALQKAGFDKLVGEENICAHIDDALKRASELTM